MKPHFEIEHIVTLADTNVVGNVYFANYVSWQGRCRERFLAEHCPSVVDGLHGDLALVTVSCACDFFSELFALDRVAVRMTLDRIVENRIEFDFDYYRVNQRPARVVARGRQVVACMVRKDGELLPADVPYELREALAPYHDRVSARS
jgi:enediyne biosynthesis thioesterase